jgi:glucose-6-phosphate 1-dehydrogenase
VAVAGQKHQQENPLVAGLERVPIHPTTLVIFGGTGDLAHRKLLPAIYNLAHEGALPERFNLIAVSRSEMSSRSSSTHAASRTRRCSTSCSSR